MGRKELRPVEFEIYDQEIRKLVFDTGHFHTWIVAEDILYAVIETEEGGIYQIMSDKIKFMD